MDLSKFHVIAVVSNPFRYASRWKLYDIFQEDIIRKGANLWTVEMQVGDRIHKVTDWEKEQHLQLGGTALSGSLWIKECLINQGISHVLRTCPDARYIAWVDADVKFEPGMIAETQHALQHWDIVQMFSHAIDLGPKGETIGNVQKGFLYCWWNGLDLTPEHGYLGKQGHPGFCYAARRDALNKIGVSISSGPLIDFGVLGSSDRNMVCSLIGKVEWSYHGDIHPNYKKWLHRWQDIAVSRLRKNVGYVDGTIRHLWHGRKSLRGYGTRWGILVNNQFDPENDLYRDASGIVQFVSESERQIQFRDDCRRYFMSRNEDSTDVSP